MNYKSQEIKDRISLAQIYVAKAKRTINNKSAYHSTATKLLLECAVKNLLSILYSIENDVELESDQTIHFMHYGIGDRLKDVVRA